MLKLLTTIKLYIMKKKIKNSVLKIPSIDVENTLVVLIGVSNYPEDNDITSIPNIKQNIKELKKIFLNSDLIGIPKENILISLNENKLEIERKLAMAANKAKSKNYTLIVYYAGHGIISAEDFKLYLTTLNSTKQFLETDSINISRFQEIISKSRANRKIVIIDACHSGQIHNHMDDLSSKLNIELNKFEGTYVVTSASEDDPSLFPHEDTKSPTYFTGCLIDTIMEGVNNNKPFCSLRDIYNDIEERLDKIGNMPKPQQSSFKNADEMVFCVNNSYNPKSEEDLYWENAVYFHRIDLYQEFIEKFPNSINIERALNLISILEGKNYESTNKISKIEYKKSVNLFSIKSILIGFSIASSIVVSILVKNSVEINSFATANKTNSFSILIENKRNMVNIFSFDKNVESLLSEAESLVYNGENYYSEALKKYYEVLDFDVNNQLAKDKIIQLNNLINQKVDEYLKNAEVYLNADNGLNEAIIEYEKILVLRPNDASIIYKIEDLKSKIN